MFCPIKCISAYLLEAWIYFLNVWIILDHIHYVTLKFQHFGQQACTFMIFICNGLICTKKVKVNMFYLCEHSWTQMSMPSACIWVIFLGAWPLKYEPSQMKRPLTAIYTSGRGHTFGWWETTVNLDVPPRTKGKSEHVLFMWIFLDTNIQALNMHLDKVFRYLAPKYYKAPKVWAVRTKRPLTVIYPSPKHGHLWTNCGKIGGQNSIYGWVKFFFYTK